MKQKKIIGLILVVLLVSIIYFYPEAEKTSTQTDIKNITIILERSGTGESMTEYPGYKLTIHGNGTVVYEGKRNVKIGGIKTTNISEEKIRQIISEIERIDFFSMSREQWIGIDWPASAIISVTLNGKTKSIENSYGVYTDNVEVQKLIELENKIDEVVYSERWLK